MEHHVAEELQEFFGRRRTLGSPSGFGLLGRLGGEHFISANYDELFNVASTTWCQHCLNTERIKSVCAKNDIPTHS